MNQGKIIEYIDQGKFICTLCLQDKGPRLHLLTPLNREINLAVKRAFLISNASINTQRPRDEIITQLKEKEALRAGLQQNINVGELWELVRDERESFDYKYLSQLCFEGEISDDHISAVVRALFEDKLYFKMKDNRFLANSEGRVEQILKERKEKARREEMLREGSAWLGRALKGNIDPAPECRKEITDLLVELALYGRDSNRFGEGKELLTRAGISNIEESREILIKLEEWEEDENLDILRMDIAVEFKEKVLTEANDMLTVKPVDSCYENLRDLPVLTVDGPSTRDFDDGVSLVIEDGIIHLGIHIADVAGAILPETALDREAAQRAASLYLPRCQVPMIPPNLSQDYLSLVSGLDRPAISLMAKLDMDGRLLDYRFTPSIINVKRQLTYEYVNESYEEDETLAKMVDLSIAMRRNRIEQGAMVLSPPEIFIEVDENSEVKIIKQEQDTPSRTMIAEFMVFYNGLASKFCKEKEIPILYRGQEKPDDIIPPDPLNYLFYVFKQRRKLKPLMVDTEPRPHKGLGLDTYTNISSPIRRYLDLVIQRQIRDFILEKPLTYDAEKLDQIRMTVDSSLRAQGIVRRNRNRYWIQKYLSNHINETFPAMVLYSMKRRHRILLTDFLLISDIKRDNGTRFEEGEAIKVQVKKADPYNDQLLLNFAGK